MKQTTRTAFALNLMEQLHCPVDSIAFSKLLENAYFLTGPYAEELDQMESAYMAQTIPAGEAPERNCRRDRRAEPRIFSAVLHELRI